MQIIYTDLLSTRFELTSYIRQFKVTLNGTVPIIAAMDQVRWPSVRGLM